MDQEVRAKRSREVRDIIFGDVSGGAQEKKLPLEDEVTKLVGDFAFGEVWARPGLPIKTRSFMTIAMLVAQHRPDQLRIHIKVGLRVGITPDEILETILHASTYGGVPTFAAARAVAHQIFEEQGILTR